MQERVRERMRKIVMKSNNKSQLLCIKTALIVPLAESCSTASIQLDFPFAISTQAIQMKSISVTLYFAASCEVELNQNTNNGRKIKLLKTK